MTAFNCSGEYYAHKAGVEAPACFHCDNLIEDLSTRYFTEKGKPLCVGCWNEVHRAVQETRLRELATIAVPSETRSSSLLRAGRVNFHD
jgi:hypothetical protein